MRSSSSAVNVLASLVAACAACSPSLPPPAATPPPALAAPPVPTSTAAQTPARPSVDDDVKALQAAAAASTTAEEIVRSLTSEVGARIAGGPKDAAAVAWAKRTLEKLGFARVRTEPVKVPHWERGAESVEMVLPGAATKKLRAIGLGGTLGTPPKGIEAEVVEVESLDALAKLDDAKVKGKIVFLNAPVMRRTRDGSGYGESVGTRFDGPKRAGEKGALAAVIRSVGTDAAMPHTGATTRKATVPGVALSGESADALHAELAARKRLRLKVTLGAKWLEPADSFNVIGEVLGKDLPDEVVLMGAHLDSWDVGQGAVDDGAGCAIVIEAARLVARHGRAPKRTVRVVLFAAEEMGISGGDAYAEQHAADAAKHIVALEADSGTGKVWGVRILGGAGAPGVLHGLARLVLPLGIEEDAAPARGGADTRGMVAKGVPVVDFEQDSSLYFDVHHTDADTFDRIDAAALRQVAAAYATAAWVIADSDTDLGRAPEKKGDGK